MTDSQPAQPASVSDETVAVTRRRSGITKRMTRKQTEIRLHALSALTPSATASTSAAVLAEAAPEEFPAE